MLVSRLNPLNSVFHALAQRSFGSSARNASIAGLTMPIKHVKSLYKDVIQNKLSYEIFFKIITGKIELPDLCHITRQLVSDYQIITPETINQYDCTDDGLLSLVVRVSQCCPLTVHTLTAHGADPNVHDSWGQTPLHFAAREDTREKTRALLEAGAVANAQDARGLTPLFLAVAFDTTDGFENTTKSVLLEHGADPNIHDAIGQAPLHIAAEHDYRETSKGLLRNGANINAKDACDWTPLHRAVDRSLKETSALLLKNGADSNAKDAVGLTPLHFAVSWQSKEIIDVLLEHGANPHTPDSFGESPLKKAKSQNLQKIVEMMLPEVRA